jgi:diguanylate cyclase (GGDEF)-like protein/PAS domain S-box-containing protein
MVPEPLSGHLAHGHQRRSDAGVRAVDFRHSRHWQRFWASYIRLSFLVLVTESLVVSGYFFLAPPEPHRVALIAISSSSAIAAFGAALFVSHIASRSWRAWFCLGATLSAGVLLTVSITLDGGLDSPLIFFIALPIMSAAIALPPLAVAICGMTAAVELGIVAVLDPKILLSADDLAMLSAFLFGAFVLTMGAAVSRSRLQADEESLLLEVERMAQTDALTGCLNHGAFYERLDAEINRALRSKELLSILVVDIDLFKAFNDSHGHAAGDAALVTVGAKMQNSNRSFDAVARIGGDEFAVILPATTLATAGDIARRMARALERPDGLDVTVSIGFASLDPREPTAKRLFRDADLGLYRAKANGRNGAASHSETMQVDSRHNEPGNRDRDEADRERLEESLREANQETIEAMSILDAIQSTTSVGLGFVDREFRILRINAMLAAVNGGSVEEQIGRKVSEVIPDLWPHLEPMYRAVLEGTPVTNREVSGETAADPGQLHYWLINLYPVDVNGEVLGVGVVVVDITDRMRWERSQANLTRAVLGALAGSVEMRDPFTAGHQERVARIAVAVATEMGLEAAEIDAIDLAARIHDLGKLAVPAEILARPGRLSDAEMQVVRGHSQAGSDLLRRVGFPDHVREMVLQHHERLDGSGYPQGLVGDQIPLGVRILAVADVLEAMASHRPYRPAGGIEHAFQELERGSGGQYDPDVVRACLRLFHDGRLPRDDESGDHVPPDASSRDHND